VGAEDELHLHAVSRAFGRRLKGHDMQPSRVTVASDTSVRAGSAHGRVRRVCGRSGSSRCGGRTPLCPWAARACGERNGPDAGTLAQLAADIEQDREELRKIVERLEQSGHPVKQAVGWIAGKVHQVVAVGEHLTRDEDLSMLLQAESLALGIEGKRALWEALLEVAHAYTELADIDLTQLIQRARGQRERIEVVRLAAARRSFTARS
jgi:hypothetical protein